MVIRKIIDHGFYVVEAGEFGKDLVKAFSLDEAIDIFDEHYMNCIGYRENRQKTITGVWLVTPRDLSEMSNGYLERIGKREFF